MLWHHSAAFPQQPQQKRRHLISIGINRVQPGSRQRQTAADSGRQGRTAKNSGCRSSSLRCKTGLLTTNCLACPPPPFSVPFRVPVADAVSVAVAGNFWAEKTSRELPLPVSSSLCCLCWSRLRVSISGQSFNYEAWRLIYVHFVKFYFTTANYQVIERLLNTVK